MVTSSCVGVTEAALLIAQPDRRGGTNYELALKCGTTGGMIVKLEAGRVFAHLVSATTEPGSAAVAGFWMVPASQSSPNPPGTVRRETGVRLKHLFHRKTKGAGCPAPELPAPYGANTPQSQGEDLQEAWAELTEAAQGSKVMNFHACTRTGTPWAQDPAAVRAVAAILRDFPADVPRDEAR